MICGQITVAIPSCFPFFGKEIIKVTNQKLLVDDGAWLNKISGIGPNSVSTTYVGLKKAI